MRALVFSLMRSEMVTLLLSVTHGQMMKCNDPYPARFFHRNAQKWRVIPVVLLAGEVEVSTSSCRCLACRRGCSRVTLSGFGGV